MENDGAKKISTSEQCPLSQPKTMEPGHVFYNELLLNENNIFSANLTGNNEIEEIKFKKSNNYAISGLSVNQEIDNKEFFPLPNTDAEHQLSELMRAYSKEKEKFNLNLSMYIEESFDIIIPFQKRKDVLVNGFQYYDTTTKKQETIQFYDYFYHQEKFGFEWNHDGPRLRYSIKLSVNKKNKKHFCEEG